MALGPVLDL
ncbi:Protein of unknown function [Bacillus wiedmannii]|uniref:Uncharacterized protein n=1 Tax=Bacillus wiedmannii TaxID=1890302 RepID=A0A1C4E8Z7_9BACI|nr:Protein of unknown function [Bacillus wiedmannii]